MTAALNPVPLPADNPTTPAIGTAVPPTDTHTYRTWLNDHNYAPASIRVYTNYVDRALKTLDLETATAAELTRFWLTLPSRAASRNQARKALIAYYKSIGRRHGEPADELDALPERRGLPRPVPAETFTLLIGAARQLGGIHEAAGALLAFTGCRLTEARTARWAAMDLTGRAPTWRITGKGSGRRGEKERVVPLAVALTEVLVRWQPSCGSEVFVFPSPTALPGVISDPTMRRIIADLADVAGVEYVTPHRYRHTVGTLALERGGDLRLVQELLGHENLNTTQIYTKVSADRLRSIVETLE